jgi:hypothetical protein
MDPDEDASKANPDPAHSSKLISLHQIPFLALTAEP